MWVTKRTFDQKDDFVIEYLNKNEFSNLINKF